jgi:23S rRNA pseudouridine1911/1915/1917 synthase
MSQNVFNVIHEDDDILVIEKLVPFLSQRADDSEKEALYEFISRTKAIELYPVHRLDREVLGLMVYGKTKAAADHLSDQFRNRTIKKGYEAWVHGSVFKDTDTLIHYLKKNSRNNYVTVFPRETPGAKRAELSYSVLEREAGRTRLFIELKTGRPHQIRAQLSKIGHSIEGDRRYGRVKVTGSEGEIRLRSVFLSLIHPRTEGKMSWQLVSGLPLPEGK